MLLLCIPHYMQLTTVTVLLGLDKTAIRLGKEQAAHLRAALFPPAGSTNSLLRTNLSVKADFEPHHGG